MGWDCLYLFQPVLPASYLSLLHFFPHFSTFFLWLPGLWHRLPANSISLFFQTWPNSVALPQSAAGLTPWSLANGAPLCVSPLAVSEHTKGRDPNCRRIQALICLCSEEKWTARTETAGKVRGGGEKWEGWFYRIEGYRSIRSITPAGKTSALHHLDAPLV